MMTYPTERIPGYHLYFLGADYFFVTTQKRLTDRLITAIVHELFPDADPDSVALRVKKFRPKLSRAEFYKTDADHATITNDMMTVAYCALGSDCFIYYL